MKDKKGKEGKTVRRSPTSRNEGREGCIHVRYGEKAEGKEMKKMKRKDSEHHHHQRKRWGS